MTIDAIWWQYRACNGQPLGLIHRNSIVVVFSGSQQNNMATLEHAQAMFPNLRILPFRQNEDGQWSRAIED